VPLEHALVLVKHLVEMKTTNMELEIYVKEMQVKMREGGIAVPSMLKPEITVSEKRSSNDDQDDDDSSVDSQDSESNSNLEPVAGKGLLE
jgi:hypothetical protein